VRNKLSTDEIFQQAKIILIGHYRYYGVTDNYPMLQQFKYEMVKILYKWLNRRSQRKSFSVKNFKQYLNLNPLPSARILVNMGKMSENRERPCEEPYALIGHVRICEGLAP
jgi:hypothetical protein